jgi:uncharacterized membrane protein YccC
MRSIWKLVAEFLGRCDNQRAHRAREHSHVLTAHQLRAQAWAKMFDGHTMIARHNTTEYINRSEIRKSREDAETLFGPSVQSQKARVAH